MTENARLIAKKIFNVIAQIEAKVHNKPLDKIHFHEVGAIDSIVDIVSFSVLIDDLNPEKVYFSTLYDGHRSVECQHGLIPVPVPAVCEIVSRYQLPIAITDTKGEMITPTGAVIAAVVSSGEKLPKDGFIIKKTGIGKGKRNYNLPILRVHSIFNN